MVIIKFLFIAPTDSEEVISIISSLVDNKSSGPNRIPRRILKLPKKDISTHLVDIFYPLFSLGICSTPLKLLKLFPYIKKTQNLDVLTTHQLHYYSILTKFWKN